MIMKLTKPERALHTDIIKGAVPQLMNHGKRPPTQTAHMAREYADAIVIELRIPTNGRKRK